MSGVITCDIISRGGSAEMALRRGPRSHGGRRQSVAGVPEKSPISWWMRVYPLKAGLFLLVLISLIGSWLLWHMAAGCFDFGFRRKLSKLREMLDGSNIEQGISFEPG